MPKRRAAGEGYPRPYYLKGKLVGYRLRVRVDGQEVYGPIVKKRSDALPAFNEQLARKLAAAEREPVRAGPKLSSSLWVLIENRLDREWRPKTVSLAKTVAKRVEMHPIGERGVFEIDAARILEWRLSLDSHRRNEEGRALEASSSHRYQRILERMLALLGNPVKAEKPIVREPLVRILTRAEQQELIDRAVQPRARLALMMLIGWGLRNGEACGLMHEDRHEMGVMLRRQVIEVRGLVLIDDTMKTDESRAWLPFPFPEMADLIGPPESGYVLATKNGTPMRPSNLRRMVQSVAEGTAYEGIGPQDLRHTAGVNLLRAGVDPKTAASITRHSVDTLLKIYHRVCNDGKAEAMQKVAAWRQAIG